MKRILYTLILTIFICTGIAQADDFPSPPHQYTLPPADARFEIIQSPLAAKWTFRLDRYYGRVSQFLKTKDDDNIWEEMPVIGLPKVKTVAKPHFQLFTSGIAARHTFLIDNETGKTWVIVTRKEKSKDGTEYERNIWQPFAE